MAFILTSTSPCVNVDYPVGGGAPNRSDDVMLVQGLLLSWAWWTELSFKGKANAVRKFDVNSFKIDGHFGPKTRALLRLFVTHRRAVGASAEGWVFPMHIEIYRSKGKTFKVQTGSVDLSWLTLEVPAIHEGHGFVDTARGKYARYGLYCVGWDMPPRLAASLAHHRSTPHYVPPALIDL